MIFVYLEEVASTNLVARQLAESNDEPIAVCARSQTSGYGRNGHHWISPYGGLWLSCATQIPTDKLNPLLALAASYATLEILSQYSSKTLSIKWPNDIMVEEAKLGGILIESAVAGSQTNLIVGIGVNIESHPKRLATDQKTTHLSKQSGQLPPLEKLTSQICVALLDEIELAVIEPQHVIEKLTPRMQTLGKTIRVETSPHTFCGVAESLTADGALIVKDTNDRRHVVYDGHIRYGIIN